MTAIDGKAGTEKDPVITADQEGVITSINDAFQETFGWSREDLVGKSLTEIIPPYLRDAHNLGFSRFITTEKPTLLGQPLSLKILMKDGREVDAIHLITAQRANGQLSFAATITLEK